MVIFPLAPDQTIAQMWSSGARGDTLLQCFDTVGWVIRPVKHCLRNDLNCVEWDVKPCSTQPTALKCLRRLLSRRSRFEAESQFAYCNHRTRLLCAGGGVRPLWLAVDQGCRPWRLIHSPWSWAPSSLLTISVSVMDLQPCSRVLYAYSLRYDTIRYGERTAGKNFKSRACHLYTLRRYSTYWTLWHVVELL